MTKAIKRILRGLALAPIVFAPPALSDDHENHVAGATGLIQAVREATRLYRDATLAEADGWSNLGHCVSSGGDEGAMGIHFVNFPEVLDGSQLKVSRPEAFMYEERNGRKRLIGVEYIVFAEEWDAAHPDGTPPGLMGQAFDYIPAPNRFRLPAVYILHVWAWKDNPNGAFSNWNPEVSCEEYAGEIAH
jgi:hypothetical protein